VVLKLIQHIRLAWAGGHDQVQLALAVQDFEVSFVALAPGLRLGAGHGRVKEHQHVHEVLPGK
jgi:hypothetical protein